MSPALEHVLGYRADALVGKSPLDFLHPDDRPMCRAHFDTVVADSTREHAIEVRGRHADGRWTDNLLALPRY